MANQTVFSYELLELTELAPTGEAIGYLDGLMVLVPYALPGETVRVALVEKKRTFARAQLIEIVTPSPARTLPLCEYFGRCAGCTWQQMRYAAQVVHKTALVRNQLMQVAKISDPLVRPCVPSLHAYGYRNSAHFTLLANGRPAYPAVNHSGPHAGNSNALIAVDECPILEPALQEALHKAAASGVAGRGDWDLHLPETVDVGNFTYFVGAQSPFQVNTPMTERLVEEVIGALEPAGDQMFLDLFCGVGLFTLPLAVMSADVIGVEPNAEAARDARRNVASIRNRLYNKVPPRILTEVVDRALGRPEIKARRTQGVVVDAPSGGLNLKICTQIAKLGAQRLVYGSSEPETLARDLKAFISAGYRLDYAQPLDMRPQTHHVHVVARLSLLQS